MSKFRRFISTITLLICYYGAVLISFIFKRFHSRAHRGRIIVNGTFHNPNWFHAHITPLVNSGFGTVILVCDEELAQMPNLQYQCPPQWATRLLSRAGAKFVWTLMCAVRWPADVFVGYHIFPSAVTALICARLTGAKTVYQVTSGELELRGGGFNAENPVMRALSYESKIVERAALAITREFDLVVVRGSSAAGFIADAGFNNRLEIVTGSVDCGALQDIERDIDLIMIGRLAEYKRPDRLLRVIKGICQTFPNCSAKIVGDGPDREALEAMAINLGIEHQVEFMGQRSDVEALLSRSKVFILTSRWEGVSIAMLEAMAMGAVPVVSDVGDLSDFAIDGESGYVFPEDDIDAATDLVTGLLSEPERRQRLSTRARTLVLEKCDRDVLARRWHQIMSDLAA